MRSSAILFIALVGTAALASWLWLQWRDEQAANLELRVRVESLERHHETPRPASPATASVPVLAAPPSAAGTPPSTGLLYNPVPNYPGMFQQRMMKNPEFRKALRNQQRVVIENELRDLPKALNLSPEQAARVFDLLADQGVRMLELQWGGTANRKDGQTLQEASHELRARNDAEMTELIGRQDMGELKEFRSSLESRNEVDALRGELARAPEPMREDQVEPMIDVVYGEQRRMDQEMRDRFGSSGAELVEYNAARTELAIAANERIVENAEALLSGAQLAVVKDFYRRQRQQMEANNELSRLRAEAMTGDAPAAKAN